MNTANRILFFLFFVGLWCAVSMGLSLIGGWFELASVYPLPRTFEGTRWHFRSANMRFGSHYGSCLTVGADPTGLFMKTLFLFRLGHAPLFIPWNSISIREVRYFLIFPRVQFRFQNAPSIPLYLSVGLGRRLREAAGSAWPVDRYDPGAAIQESLRA
jgi:hypothetical protein